ncbi:MAG: hypothetical protein ABR585_00560 [Gemmatimonadaceae bacterium]
MFRSSHTNYGKDFSDLGRFFRPRRAIVVDHAILVIRIARFFSNKKKLFEPRVCFFIYATNYIGDDGIY